MPPLGSAAAPRSYCSAARRGQGSGPRAWQVFCMLPGEPSQDSRGPCVPGLGRGGGTVRPAWPRAAYVPSLSPRPFGGEKGAKKLPLPRGSITPAGPHLPGRGLLQQLQRPVSLPLSEVWIRAPAGQQRGPESSFPPPTPAADLSHDPPPPCWEERALEQPASFCIQFIHSSLYNVQEPLYTDIFIE